VRVCVCVRVCVHVRFCTRVKQQFRFSKHLMYLCKRSNWKRIRLDARGVAAATVTTAARPQILLRIFVIVVTYQYAGPAAHNAINSAAG